MTQDEQLERWVAGESVHIADQCVPDFSCCAPELRAADDVREVFAIAYRANDLSTCSKLMARFLTAMLEHHLPETKVEVLVTPRSEPS